jgi:hypothetical protein
MGASEEDLIAKAREEDLDQSIRDFIDRALDREEGRSRTVTCPWA